MAKRGECYRKRQLRKVLYTRGKNYFDRDTIVQSAAYAARETAIS